MTDQQSNSIMQLRKAGKGYGSIAILLGLSKNTVKSYCQRHDLEQTQPEEAAGICPQCGKAFEQNEKRKAKRFCSDACRLTWWKHHTEQVKRKAIYQCHCVYCGQLFQSYGNKSRKYCTRACYFLERFGRFKQEGKASIRKSPSSQSNKG